VFEKFNMRTLINDLSEIFKVSVLSQVPKGG
jgi:hypothetical protein